MRYVKLESGKFLLHLEDKFLNVEFHRRSERGGLLERVVLDNEIATWLKQQNIQYEQICSGPYTMMLKFNSEDDIASFKLKWS